MLAPLLSFALPLILSGMLQLLYNAADVVIVGQFSGKESLAAVGSTGHLTNLLTNAFLGLSVGSNVLISKAFGLNDKEKLSRAVHTAILLSLIGGVIIGIIGILFSAPLLSVMGTPDDVIGKASLYMKIYFAGLPAVALYNFGSAILRAVGDTKRPLYFLTISGIINVVLNLIFVIVFKMDVAGVALATIISQIFSGLMIIICLKNTTEGYKLFLRKLRIYKSEMLQILRVGLPAGIQGSLFSLSNVLIQSTVNTFGSAAVAGNSAASSIENFVYIAMNAIHHASLTFTAQNFGVSNFERIKKGFYYCLALVSIIGLVMGLSVSSMGKYLVNIYSSDPEVISIGVLKLSIVCSGYLLCGIMEVHTGTLRGMGYSILPMILTLVGSCALRIIWIFTIYKLNPTLAMLYVVYPISWFCTIIALFIAYKYAIKHYTNKLM